MKFSMTFIEGNQEAKKLKTDELKRDAYDQYCAHLAKGKSKRSWYFQHPSLSLTWETMEKYIKEDTSVFDPTQKKHAEAQGFAKWEQVVEDSAIGQNKDANVAALQMLMRNKYKWDRHDQVHEDDLSSADANEKLLNQISNLQKKV
jgi:hypothetical protein